MQVARRHTQTKNDWLTPADKRILKYAAFTGGIIIVGGVAYFTTRHIYRKRKSNKAEGQSLNDGTPENFAKRIKMAFDNDGWWGTDVEALRQVFTEIPNQETFIKVVTNYEAITKQEKGSFFRDLTSELTTSEYYEMQSILKGKPGKAADKPVFNWISANAMGHRIKAAFDYTILGMPSTDKGALETALRQIPSLYAFAMVKISYKKEYGHEIEDDLNSELDVFDFSWQEIIYKKPKTANESIKI